MFQVSLQLHRFVVYSLDLKNEFLEAQFWPERVNIDYPQTRIFVNIFKEFFLGKLNDRNS